MSKYQEALNKIKPTTSNYDLIEATKAMQELVDKETKINKLHNELYEAYHHGTREDTDEVVTKIIENIEFDWSDEE